MRGLSFHEDGLPRPNHAVCFRARACSITVDISKAMHDTTTQAGSLLMVHVNVLIRASLCVRPKGGHDTTEQDMTCHDRTGHEMKMKAGRQTGDGGWTYLSSAKRRPVPRGRVGRVGHAAPLKECRTRAVG